MLPLIIGTTLPNSIQKQLKAICYGIPEVKWTEEFQFLLSLRYMGAVPDQHLLEIKERLRVFSFPSFFTSIQGVEAHRAQKRRGNLWAKMETSTPIVQLSKEIDLICRAAGIPSTGPRQPPRILLGHYAHLNPVRLAEYQANHHAFHIDGIPIDHISIFEADGGSELIRYRF